MIHKRGGFYHHQFQIDGKRYRGSTKSTNKAEALPACHLRSIFSADVKPDRGKVQFHSLRIARGQ